VFLPTPLSLSHFSLSLSPLSLSLSLYIYIYIFDYWLFSIRIVIYSQASPNKIGSEKAQKRVFFSEYFGFTTSILLPESLLDVSLTIPNPCG